MTQKKQAYKKPVAKKPAASPVKSKNKLQGRFNYRVIFIAAAILVVTFIVFYPSVKNGFTNWDDPGYVTENNIITKLSAETVKYIFSNFMMTNYHPLTMLSIAVDYNSVKLDPARYHWINVLFHVLNTLLVFIFIYRLGGKKLIPAAVVALLFGIHPMHVESVSWISGRKDVLFTFFFVLGLISYHRYAAKETKRILFYIVTLLLFILSLLSKPAAVTFPIVMLLMDFFMKRRFGWKCWLEKIPFLLVAVFFGILSIKAQSEAHAISQWGTMGIHHRIFFASFGFVAYIFKFIVPYYLSAFYPYPVRFPITEALPVVYYAAPAIIAGILFLLYKSLKISRVYVFGFLFFLVNVLLILQFLSVGAALMADRYTYLPFIGLAFIAGMELDRLFKSNKPSLRIIKYIVAVIIAGYGITLCYITFERTKVWKNNDALWTDVIEKYPGKVETAYKNRGNYYAREAKLYDKALTDYNSFIAINPTDASIFSNRGNLHALMQKYDESLKDYSYAIKNDSTYYDAYINRGITYMTLKKFDLALPDLNKAIMLDPAKPDGYKNRANCLINLARYDEAIAEYNSLITKTPEDFYNYFFRGIAYFNLKEYDKALADFSKTIEMNPGHTEAWANRSQTYNMMGDYKNALADALKAQQMGQALNKEYIEGLKAKTN